MKEEPLLLPQVTLCCIDSTARLPWSVKALAQCMESVQFGEVLVFTDAESLCGTEVPEGVRWIEIEPLRGIAAYSHFVIKSLAAHISTTHILIVQWDGFVLNAEAWRDEFLGFDYIGAPWAGVPERWAVGNGGFSLRSLRLLKALQSPEIVVEHPEDICICRTNRSVLEAQGMRFPSVELARQFAVEAGSLASGPFGFHGPWHLFNVLASDEGLALVQSFDSRLVFASHFRVLMDTLKQAARRDLGYLPALATLRSLVRTAIDGAGDEWLTSPGALHLCAALAALGELDAAQRLLHGRRAVLGRPWAEPALGLRLKKKRLAALLGWGR